MNDLIVSTEIEAFVEEMWANIPGLSPEDRIRMGSISKTFSSLTMAKWGGGKTRALGTLPLPVIVYGFDPKMSVVLELAFPELVQRGWILILPLWDESDHNDPILWYNFEELFSEHYTGKEKSFINRFASVGMDSLTTLLGGVTNAVIYEKNNQKDANGKVRTHMDNPSRSDYNLIYSRLRRIIHELQGCDVNVVMNAHLEEVWQQIPQRNADPLRQLIGYDLVAFNALKKIIPPLFTEKYIIRREEKPGGKEAFELLTRPDGLYYASSQFASSGKLDPIEIPNYTRIMMKAGYPIRHKPHWLTGEEFDPALYPDWMREEIKDVA